jgi:8-oxo-dGTP pyrophosphatase MutT (NUDIX family)/DNA-binding CsgD family transcriptional regulator
MNKILSFEKSIGAVVFRREDEKVKFLLLRYLGGHWGFIKGHGENDEVNEETLRREAREETGITELKIVPGFLGREKYFYVAKREEKELFLRLKKELQQLQKNTKIGDDTTELKQLLKTLSEEQKLDEEWNNFFRHFNSVHGDFLNILKKKFPNLSPHYLRLCAYLRINLSSKEIAPLMGISLRGVEINRYRLRKQLDIPTDVNLIEYLLNLEDDKDS